MIGLVQRVSQARVVVDDVPVGEIGRGVLLLLCAERGDAPPQIPALLEKTLSLRIFPDERGRMNRSLRDLAIDPPQSGGAGLLVVPQFTLAADTRSGTRPSFTPAADPATARNLFDEFVAAASNRHREVAQGVFGADMKVSLTNDGPVTIWLRVAPGP